MLNAVLDKLNALVPKTLIVSAFFPIVVFISINGALLWATSGTFRLVVSGGPVDSATALTTRALLGALLIVALTYALSSLQPWLRETLEGSNWPQWLVHAFRPLQWERYQKLREEMIDALQRRDALFAESQKWEKRLDDAREAGVKLKTCSFTGLSDASLKAFDDIEASVARGDEVAIELFDTIFKELEPALTHNSASLKSDATSADLARSRRRFNEYVKQAVHAANMAATRAVSRFHTNFSGERLAPTAIGNIAATIVSYAYGRYEFNVDVMWTRLQKVMQRDATGFYGVVQDSKTQLDFVVGMFWALLVSAIGWVIVLPFATHTVWFYIAVVVAFPLACGLAYAVVLVSYRAFADLIRSSVDLYRFDLIDALHLHKPPSLSAERKLWHSVDQDMSYGGNIDLPYEHKA